MTQDERRTMARTIAAAANQLIGCSDDYCKFMREGAYDDDVSVLAALGAIIATESRARKSNVVDIAA